MSYEKTSSKLAIISTIIAIVSTSLFICQQIGFDVKDWFGFQSAPTWEGKWKMHIGTDVVGETECLFRIENGRLIGAYTIMNKNKGKIFTTQMNGTVDKNRYTGEWYQFSDSLYQARGEFHLILNDAKAFQGNYHSIKLDGSKSKSYNWRGEKLD